MLDKLRRLRDRVFSDPLQRRYASGAFWSLVGHLGWRVLSAATTIFVARLLGPTSLGQFGLARSTAEIFQPFAGFRLGHLATRSLGGLRGTNRTKAAAIHKFADVTCAVLCTSAMLLLFFFLPQLAKTVSSDVDLAIPILLAGTSVLLSTYTEMQLAALAGLEEFKLVARVSAIRGVLTPVLVLLPTAYWGLNGLLSGHVVLATIVLILSLMTVRVAARRANLPRVPMSASWAELSLLWTFCVPGFIPGVISSSANWFGRTMLAGQDGGTLALGLYTAADQWRLLIVLLPSVVSRVALPLLAERVTANALEDVGQIIRLQLTLITSFVTPVAIVIVAFSEPLAEVFGKAFGGSDDVIAVLVPAVVLRVMNESVRPVYDATGKLWSLNGMYLTMGAVFLFCCASWVPSWLAIGLAASQVTAEAVLLTLQVAHVEFALAPGAVRKIKWSTLCTLSLLLLASGCQTSLSTELKLPALVFILGLCILNSFLVVRHSNSS